MVLGVICCPFGMLDQNRGVKGKTSESDWKWEYCWRKDTLRGESWRIAAVLLLNPLGMCFQNAFKNLKELFSEFIA